MSETYCGACGDHAPTILGRCASCWGDRPLETALADMVLLAREAEEVRAENRRLREALERVADGGCERVYAGDCWTAGYDPDAEEYADRVCDPCFAHRALASTPPDTEGQP